MRKRKVVGRIFGKLKVERATKTEKTQELSKKGWASSVGLYQKHKPQHPHHVKVNMRGPTGRKQKYLQSVYLIYLFKGGGGGRRAGFKKKIFYLINV